MTHELLPRDDDEFVEGAEQPGGPEYTHALPDALSVPVADAPDELAPIDHPAYMGADLDEVTQ